MLTSKKDVEKKKDHTGEVPTVPPQEAPTKTDADVSWEQPHEHPTNPDADVPWTKPEDPNGPAISGQA